MKNRERALALDMEERPIEAADAYEAALREADAELELFLNLAALYAVSTDTGFAAYHKLPQHFVSKAYARAIEVLEEAQRRFGDMTDILFWRHYVAFLVGHNVPAETYEELAKRGDSLLPLCALFLQSGGTRHRAAAEAVLDAVRNRSSERKRLLYSVLDGMLGASPGSASTPVVGERASSWRKVP